jgi:hypothetical protein
MAAHKAAAITALVAWNLIRFLIRASSRSLLLNAVFLPGREPYAIWRALAIGPTSVLVARCGNGLRWEAGQNVGGNEML